MLSAAGKHSQAFLRSRFFRFLVAGGLAAICNFGSRFFYSLFVDFSTAVVFAFMTGLTAGYLLNKRFVSLFRSPRFRNPHLAVRTFDAGRSFSLRAQRTTDDGPKMRKNLITKSCGRVAYSPFDCIAKLLEIVAIRTHDLPSLCRLAYQQKMGCRMPQSPAIAVDRGGR